MKIIFILSITIVVICAGTGWSVFMQQEGNKNGSYTIVHEKMKLPEPRYKGNTSVEQALLKRRSIREYKDEKLSLDDVSQILWAAQGITDARDLRTAPSAGALYPLELYLVVGNVSGLNKGIYKYRPQGHGIEKIKDGDVRGELSDAALGQACIKNGAIDIVFSGVYGRTTIKYGDRGIQYVHMESGHAAQNVFLQAVALDLGAAIIGAFHDNAVKRILLMSDNEQPLYIMPIGKM